MAKIITPTETLSVPAFQFSSANLQDVFELGVLAAKLKYAFEVRCVEEVEGNEPVWTLSIIPKGLRARKSTPTVTVKNTEWVIYQDGAFTVRPDAEISGGSYNIEDAPPPTVETDPQPSSRAQPEPAPQPEPAAEVQSDEASV